MAENATDGTTALTRTPDNSQELDAQRSPDSLPPVPDVPAAAVSPSHQRSGDDTRHRGWFWHWNSIVTQYAPLIGLKGIGLLNSYTTWTDRREHSPFQGYAFPSQKSEAAFYGEDRAELITINKILVALDLIEIRKEMILRTDDQGRRWKVPHNFYRVKDRSTGSDLTYHDVVRVIELAANDKAVFRYLRRLFSSKFKPIDANNPWHAIIDLLEDNSTWRELRARVATSEAKASARARAGHRSRSKNGKRPARDNEAQSRNAVQLTNGHPEASTLSESEHSGSEPAGGVTTVEPVIQGLTTNDDPVNSGLPMSVEQLNSGSERNETSNAEEDNTGLEPIVERSNTTYYQETTTTTTTDGASAEAELDGRAHTLEVAEPLLQAAAAGKRRLVSETDRPGSGEDERHLPDANPGRALDDPGALVVSLFESANDRTATGLERILLAELVRDADPAARAASSTGADWVAAALREAVASGSSFVAPKRIREIVRRWAADGVAPERLASITLHSDPQRQSGDQELKPTTPRRAGRDDVHLESIWKRSLNRLRRSLDQEAYDRLFAGSYIKNRTGGKRVEIAIASAAAVEKLSLEYQPLVVRALSAELKNDVDVSFCVADPPRAAPDEGEVALASQIVITEAEERSGRQLWSAVLAQLDGSIPRRDLEHLRGVVPLGQNDGNELVLGVPGQFAGRLLELRYSTAIEAALRRLLDAPVRLRLCGPDDWVVTAVQRQG